VLREQTNSVQYSLCLHREILMLQHRHTNVYLFRIDGWTFLAFVFSFLLDKRASLQFWVNVLSPNFIALPHQVAQVISCTFLRCFGIVSLVIVFQMLSFWIWLITSATDALTALSIRLALAMRTYARSFSSYRPSHSRFLPAPFIKSLSSISAVTVQYSAVAGVSTQNFRSPLQPSH